MHTWPNVWVSFPMCLWKCFAPSMRSGDISSEPEPVSSIIQLMSQIFPVATSHPAWSGHDQVVEMEEYFWVTTPARLACAGGKCPVMKGWCEIHRMPTLWDIDSTVRTCSESTATPFMWEKLGTETMRIFFIAHPGQIDGLCCGRSLLSVYNVAFALHCPDPATPKGNWFLPLCCPFTSLSSLSLFSYPPSSHPHFSFFSHLLLLFPPFLLSLTHTPMSSWFCCPHLSSSFISFALLPSSLPPALLSCLLVLLPYTVSQSPQLVFAPRFVHTRSAPSFIFLSCRSVLIFSLPPLSLSLLCLHPPSV